MKTNRIFATLVLACSAITASAADSAPAFPTQQINLYTPFPGYNDVMARLISAKMSEELGQSIVVQNLPGAGGALAAVKVKAAQSDGYTLLYGSNGMFTINDIFNPNLPYKTTDFTPVSLAYSDPMLLLVTPDLPVKNVAELVQYAKAHPGKVTFGSSGVGTITHLAGEVLKSMSKTDMVHVPYKGSAQALTDLIGGRISMLFFPPQESMQYIKTGKVRVLAVSSKTRTRSLPEVQTLDELGYTGYDLKVWYGFFAPAKVPRPVIDKLQKAIANAVQSLDLPSRDLNPGGNTPAQFQEMILHDRAALQATIRESGLKIEQ